MVWQVNSSNPSKQRITRISISRVSLEVCFCLRFWNSRGLTALPSSWSSGILVAVMQTDLRGKVVIITGASGGIGSAIARKFAAEGSRLVLHYRGGRHEAEALRRELSDADVLLVRADLTGE